MRTQTILKRGTVAATVAAAAALILPGIAAADWRDFTVLPAEVTVRVDGDTAFTTITSPPPAEGYATEPYCAGPVIHTKATADRVIRETENNPADLPNLWWSTVADSPTHAIKDAEILEKAWLIVWAEGKRTAVMPGLARGEYVAGVLCTNTHASLRKPVLTTVPFSVGGPVPDDTGSLGSLSFGSLGS